MSETPPLPEPGAPAIVLVSGEHCDHLKDAFWRYSREYDLRTARSSAEALRVASEVLDGGAMVAMFVSDSVLPDDDIKMACRRWQATVPTARRVIAPPIERFLAQGHVLRPEMSKGTFDSYLIMPQGVRDEDFHNSITDLLSDWNSTVAAPEVIGARIIAGETDALVQDIQDFLDRMGVSCKVHPPDSERGRAALAELPDARLPVVWLVHRPPMEVSSVRQLAASVYRSITESSSRASSIWRSSGPVHQGWQRPYTGPRKVSRRWFSSREPSAGRPPPVR